VGREGTRNGQWHWGAELAVNKLNAKAHVTPLMPSSEALSHPKLHGQANLSRPLCDDVQYMFFDA
jgi:hypothetical protein